MSDDLTTRLFQSTSRLTRFLRSVAGGHETGATWRVLALVHDDGPLRVTEIATLDMLTQPSATSIVRRMVDDGLLERHPDPDDRRASLVGTTERGRERLATYRADAARALRPHLQGLDPADRADLDRAVEVLDRLVTRATEHRTGRPAPHTRTTDHTTDHGEGTR